MEHWVTDAEEKASSSCSSKMYIECKRRSTIAGELRLLSPKIDIPVSMIKLSCKGGAPLLPLSSPQKVVELGGATHPAAAAAAFKQEPLAYLIDPKIL